MLHSISSWFSYSNSIKINADKPLTLYHCYCDRANFRLVHPSLLMFFCSFNNEYAATDTRPGALSLTIIEFAIVFRRTVN